MVFERPTTVLRVYVGGLRTNTTASEIRAGFARVGVELSDLELVVNRSTGFQRAFAFVVVAQPPAEAMATSDDAILARMGEAQIEGHPVVVRHVARQLTPDIPHGPEAAGRVPVVRYDGGFPLLTDSERSGDARR